MKPLEVIKRMAMYFRDRPDAQCCLIGGHAASLYRSQERLTNDVDFAVCAHPCDESRSVAEEAIRSLGLKPVLGFVVSQEKGIGNPALVSSTPEPGNLTGPIDILLPELPWVQDAVLRAQKNLVDLGVVQIPVITPEDLIVAKSYAFLHSPDRFQDLDDLKHIFQTQQDLDREYLKKTLHKLNIPLPDQIKSFSPL